MIQGIYKIKIKGQLDSGWVEWFEGWAITQEEDSTTVLTRLHRMECFSRYII